MSSFYCSLERCKNKDRSFRRTKDTRTYATVIEHFRALNSEDEMLPIPPLQGPYARLSLQKAAPFPICHYCCQTIFKEFPLKKGKRKRKELSETGPAVNLHLLDRKGMERYIKHYGIKTPKEVSDMQSKRCCVVSSSARSL